MADAAQPPEVISPNELAKHLGISARRVRNDARRFGLCHVVGNKMFLTQADIDGLMEAWRPKPQIAPVPNEPQVNHQELLRLKIERHQRAEREARRAEREKRKKT